MKIHLDNVNLTSRSGPNSFAKRLAQGIFESGNELVLDSGENADVSIVFIEPTEKKLAKKVIQRLDGIWFKPEDYESKNKRIKELYQNSDHVIWQSDFDSKMTTKWWGAPKDGSVIRNGINLNLEDFDVTNVRYSNLYNSLLELRKVYSRIFVASANWHPQKRLDNCVELFDQIKKSIINKDERCCLIVLGFEARTKYSDPDVFFAGNVPHDHCEMIYRMSDWMIHLGWADHCPNVVVEALKCDLPVICGDVGGTKELVEAAGNYGIILKDAEYNFELYDYDRPPTLNVEQLEFLPDLKTTKANKESIDIRNVVNQYINVIKKII